MVALRLLTNGVVGYNSSIERIGTRLLLHTRWMLLVLSVRCTRLWQSIIRKIYAMSNSKALRVRQTRRLFLHEVAPLLSHLSRTLSRCVHRILSWHTSRRWDCGKITLLSRVMTLHNPSLHLCQISHLLPLFSNQQQRVLVTTSIVHGKQQSKVQAHLSQSLWRGLKFLSTQSHLSAKRRSVTLLLHSRLRSGIDGPWVLHLKVLTGIVRS